ncbi:hypothetical protein AMTR_s00138p00018790 [Amborella trichopoda]|uniref:Uncharacterized protein n=1 Tax=Amborella trichopoda TaxID=13333 RepID=W1NEL0_AMBTC|nr:hypothetical protein AMTR_s00138p00018790 [Amborella trichopoda]
MSADSSVWNMIENLNIQRGGGRSECYLLRRRKKSRRNPDFGAVCYCLENASDANDSEISSQTVTTETIVPCIDMRP